MARDLNYRVSVDASNAEAGIRSFTRAVNRELATVDKSLDDTATSSQRVAAALAKLADDARTELAGASRAADALGNALGPELAARLGRNGIAQYVGDLTRLGTSFEQIEADADELAASIRQIEQVKVDAADAGLSNLGGRLSEVDDAARGAGSAMANMIGNTAQDMSGMLGVTGSLGVAFGQMGEYAADAALGGQDLASSLGAMAKVAGPIAALGLATKLLTDAFNKGKAAAAEQAKGVERLVAAAERGEGVLGALNDQLADTGKLSFTFGGGFDFAGAKVDDLRENLAAAGLTMQDFARLTTLSRDAFSQELVAMKNRGIAEEDLVQIGFAYEAMTRQVAEAELSLALNRQVGAGAADAAKVATEGLTGAVSAGAVELDQMAAKGRDAGTAMDRARDAFDRLTGRIDAKRSVLDLRDQFDRLREAGQLAWDAAVNGEANAEEAQRNYQRELLNTESLVADYGEEIAKLPPERVTAILADIDNQSIQTADELLARLAAERDAVIRVRVVGANAGWIGGGGSNAPIPTMMPTDGGPVPAGVAAGAPTGRAAGPDADGWAPMHAPAAAAGAPIVIDVPVRAVPVTVDLRGAVLGSRYDVVRLVRAATRDGVRLGGTR